MKIIHGQILSIAVKKQTILDQINLVQGRVPFKKITAVAGFSALMLKETDVKKLC